MDRHHGNVTGMKEQLRRLFTLLTRDQRNRPPTDHRRWTGCDARLGQRVLIAILANRTRLPCSLSSSLASNRRRPALAPGCPRNPEPVRTNALQDRAIDSPALPSGHGHRTTMRTAHPCFGSQADHVQVGLLRTMVIKLHDRPIGDGQWQVIKLPGIAQQLEAIAVLDAAHLTITVLLTFDWAVVASSRGRPSTVTRSSGARLVCSCS